jgi:hypothetical protein
MLLKMEIPSSGSIWADIEWVGEHARDMEETLGVEHWVSASQTDDYFEAIQLSFIDVEENEDGVDSTFYEEDLRDKLYCFLRQEAPLSRKLFDHNASRQRNDFLRGFHLYLKGLGGVYKQRFNENQEYHRKVKLREAKQKQEETKEDEAPQPPSNMTDWDGVSNKAMALLRGVFPYTEWEKEVKGLGETTHQQQIDAAVSTVISDCYEPPSRYLRELAYWRRVDDRDRENARVRATVMEIALRELNSGSGTQVRRNPEYDMHMLRRLRSDSDEQEDVPEYILVTVDFAEDVPLQSPRDWSHAFSFWLHSYVIDYDRWPPSYRVSTFKRFCRAFGAKNAIKTLYYIDEQDALNANPEILPRVAMELEDWRVDRLVARKTKDWDDPDFVGEPIECMTLAEVEEEWTRIYNSLIVRYDNGTLINQG